MKKILLLVVIMSMPKILFAETLTFNDKNCIRAIIGEASSEGFDGLLAVSCALRNRGTLKGVYGLKAKHVDKEPQWVWDMARKAWEKSEYIDVVDSADHWENEKAFGKPSWSKNMIKVKTIGSHSFYRKK